VVVYGQVKLGFTSPQGVEKVIEIVRPGQSFGEALMFLDKPYIVFAQALADSMLLHVARRTVLDELQRDPGFALRMLSGLSRRLHGLVRDVEGYTLRSSHERVIGYLLAEVPESANGGAAEVHLTPGKSVIASRLNMTPEHFSRILHELGNAGLVEIQARSARAWRRRSRAASASNAATQPSGSCCGAAAPSASNCCRRFSSCSSRPAQPRRNSAKRMR
jgi:CRP-like cAMP-binding protein